MHTSVYNGIHGMTNFYARTFQANENNALYLISSKILKPSYQSVTGSLRETVGSLYPELLISMMIQIQLYSGVLDLF